MEMKEREKKREERRVREREMGRIGWKVRSSSSWCLHTISSAQFRQEWIVSTAVRVNKR